MGDQRFPGVNRSSSPMTKSRGSVDSFDKRNVLSIFNNDSISTHDEMHEEMACSPETLGGVKQEVSCGVSVMAV